MQPGRLSAEAASELVASAALGYKEHSVQTSPFACPQPGWQDESVIEDGDRAVGSTAPLPASLHVRRPSDPSAGCLDVEPASNGPAMLTRRSQSVTLTIDTLPSYIQQDSSQRPVTAETDGTANGTSAADRARSWNPFKRKGAAAGKKGNDAGEAALPAESGSMSRTASVESISGRRWARSRVQASAGSSTGLVENGAGNEPAAAADSKPAVPPASS